MAINTEQAGPDIKPKAASGSDSTPSPMVAALQRSNPEWVAGVTEAFEETTILIPRQHIVSACDFLKNTARLDFNFLSDICGVDLGPEEEPRFQVNYHLFSTTMHHRLRLKVQLSEEDLHVPTVTTIWRTANWHERETYDLFGVIFDGHPDLRRILLPDDWKGHALRKDFPLRGYEPYSLT